MQRLKGRRLVPVVPNVQQYEFEGLLFSNPDAVANVMRASKRQLEDLRKVRSHFTTPEEINDSPISAPSKRVIEDLSGLRQSLARAADCNSDERRWYSE